MTIEALHKEVIATRKDIKELKALLFKTQDEWIGEKEAAAMLSMSPSTLRQMRYAGKVSAYRVRPTGRGIQYLKSSLESQFITNK